MKTLRTIDELTIEELHKLFNRNENLRNDVRDDMIDTAYFYCEEYIGAFPKHSIEYEYGAGCYCYMCHRYDKEEEFIEGLENAQRNFCFLSDEWDEKIANVHTMICKLKYGIYNMSLDEYFDLKNEIENRLKEIEDACGKRLSAEFEDCDNEEYMLDYFDNNYVDYQMNDCFFDDELNVYKKF